MGVWRVINVVLVLAIVGSALATVLVTYRYHQLHREMQRLEDDASALKSDRERHELQLRGYFEFGRIKQIALHQLGMYAPAADQIKYIKIEELSAQQSEQ